jgi:hypothetical protein
MGALACASYPAFSQLGAGIILAGARSLRKRRIHEARSMKFVESIDRSTLEGCGLVAESTEFAIFDVGNDTYGWSTVTRRWPGRE